MRLRIWDSGKGIAIGTLSPMGLHETVDVDLSPDELERFSRHLTLPEVGMTGQKRLKVASVLCVGSGGLGLPVLLDLAAAAAGPYRDCRFRCC